MKNTTNPSEFLGSKALSPLEKKRIKGGMMHHSHVQCQRYAGNHQQQIDPPTQQQQIQNEF